MKKNKIILLSAMTAALILGATACSTPKTEPTTEASTSATTEETKEATEAAAEVTEAPTEASAAGKIDADGKFTSASGKYELVIPKGWTIDPSSDEELTTFLSPDGTDYIEITSLAGDDVQDEAETLPPTADEYKKLVARGDEQFDITNYSVEDRADNGGQTYHYSIKYGPESDVKYLSATGDLDLAKKEYINATATAETEGEDIIKTIDAAIASLNILK